jgi:aspartate/methionine/tyrosine aminotransferase
MRRFPSSPITQLIDDKPSVNLGESTCRDLSVEELLGPRAAAAVGPLPLGYRTSSGDPELRALIAASTGTDPDHVLVTAGAGAALSLLALLFGEGDGEFLVVRPCFPPVMDSLRGIGGRVVTTMVTFDGGYRLDPASVAAGLSARTRLVLVASPQNPSGVALARDEIDKLLAEMSRVSPEAWLVVDETYREAVYGDAPVPESFATASPRVITCASLSKSHGAPGLRIGWLTVPHAGLYDQLRLAKFNTGISCGALDEVLATELLRRATAVLGPRRAFLAEALPVVRDWVERHHDHVRWVPPDAGAMCCIQLRPEVFGPGGMARFHSRLAEYGVLVSRGEWFGDSPYVVRLGFGHEPMERLRAGLDLVGEALRTSARG